MTTLDNTFTLALLQPLIERYSENTYGLPARTDTGTAIRIVETLIDVEPAARLRALLAEADAALADETYDRQIALESLIAGLRDLLGEPEPAPEPELPAIVAQVWHTLPRGPFDRIIITHPDGRTELLQVPERVTLPSGHVTRLGPSRFHATLRAAGYRAIASMTGPGADEVPVERLPTDAADA